MTVITKLHPLVVFILNWSLVNSAFAQSSAENHTSPTSLPCQQDFSFNQAALGSFDSTKETFYHFAQISRTKGEENSLATYFKYKLIAINLNDLKIKTIMDIELPQLSGAIVFGNPIYGVITTTLEEGDSDCFFGRGFYAALKISLKTKEIQFYKDRGTLTVVREKSGFNLFDFLKKEVIELDLSKSQKTDLQARKQKYIFPDGEIPLFMDEKKKHFYTWHFLDDYAQRGLIAYDGRGNAVGRLQYARGDKLIQHINLFGVLTTNTPENKLSIMEIAKWTDVPISQSYNLTLPASIPIAETSVLAHFPKGFAVIAGNKDADRRRWGKVYLYDYHSNKELTHSNPPQGAYTKNIYFTDNGILMICENGLITTGDFHSYDVYNTKEKTWKSLTL